MGCLNFRFCVVFIPADIVILLISCLVSSFCMVFCEVPNMSDPNAEFLREIKQVKFFTLEYYIFVNTLDLVFCWFILKTVQFTWYHSSK